MHETHSRPGPSRLLAALTLAALVLSLTPALAQPTPGHARQEIDDYFSRLTADGLFSGSVLVAREGKVILSKGYGLANYETGDRNRPRTVFAIASLTKAFTAMSVVMLAEAGLLSLEDPVAWYVDDFPGGEAITLRHLLNQTSGLYEYLDNPLLWQNASLPHTPEELLDYFIHEPLSFTPGTRFEYCNPNYVTLGLIIERVSGLPYRDFLRLHILEPLGMDRTGYDPEETDFPDRAVGYEDPFTDPPLLPIYFHPTVPYAAGAMVSTVEDLYRWDQALYSDGLVPFERLEEMFTPGLGDYGQGWYSDELDIAGEAHRQVWHWGAYFGFHGYFARFVDDRVTVILLSNLAPPTYTPEDLKPAVVRVAEILFADGKKGPVPGAGGPRHRSAAWDHPAEP